MLTAVRTLVAWGEQEGHRGTFQVIATLCCDKHGSLIRESVLDKAPECGHGSPQDTPRAPLQEDGGHSRWHSWERLVRAQAGKILQTEGTGRWALDCPRHARAAGARGSWQLVQEREVGVRLRGSGEWGEHRITALPDRAVRGLLAWLPDWSQWTLAVLVTEQRKRCPMRHHSAVGLARPALHMSPNSGTLTAKCLCGKDCSSCFPHDHSARTAPERRATARNHHGLSQCLVPRSLIHFRGHCEVTLCPLPDSLHPTFSSSCPPPSSHNQASNDPAQLADPELDPELEHCGAIPICHILPRPQTCSPLACHPRSLLIPHLQNVLEQDRHKRLGALVLLQRYP